MGTRRVPLAVLPTHVTPLCSAFVAGLGRLLGEGLMAAYLHGATVFPETSEYHGDIDLYVIVRRSLTVRERTAIESLHSRLAARFPGAGGDMDIWYVTARDAREREQPRHQIRPDLRDGSWALHRAHFLAGRLIVLRGAAPDFLPAPSWRELRQALGREFRFVERALRSDDAGAYGVLNLCRILCSLETREVAISKEAAARWAREHLRRRDRGLIDAARRTYRGKPRPTDDSVLRYTAPRFLAYARRRIERAMGKATDI